MKNKHPGVELEKKLKSIGMKNKELAIRTGVTEKHVSTIINGMKAITNNFARKLEYALDEPKAEYWVTLQAKYDKEFSEEQDKYNIDKDESKVLKEIKIIMPYLYEIGVLNENDDNIKKILDLRRFARISNLINIANLPHYGAYRIQLKTNVNINPYVLYIWQCACEYIAKKVKIENEVNYTLLKEKLPQIKSLMFSDPQNIENELQKIFYECGIIFKIVKYFKGAPVHGFIKKLGQSNNVVLCMTFRQKRADVFWFTLLHEIGHILNKDENNYLVDFEFAKGDEELEADNFANKELINQNDYKRFVDNDVFTLPAIKRFAKSQNVQPYIVIGRLQHDQIIGWNEYVNEIPKYEFIEEQINK